MPQRTSGARLVLVALAIVGCRNGADPNATAPKPQLFQSPASSQTWDAVELPVPLHGHRMHEVADGILLFGGFRAGRMQAADESRETWFFDPKLGRWREVGRLNHGKSFFGSAVVNGIVYAIGTTIERYDPQTERWTSVYHNNALPTSHFGTAVLEGKIVIVASRIHRFDPKQGTCQELPPWPGKGRGDHFHCIASVGNTLHVVGGLDGETFDPKADHWTFAENCWSRLPDAPRPVFAKFGVIEVIDHRLFILTDQVGLSYDTMRNGWSVHPKMPRPVSMPASVASRGRILVLGGLPTDGTIRRRQTFDILKGEWIIP